MNSSSIKEYLRHYGRIRSLRGSVIRSTFKRVTAAFDEYDKEEVDAALRELSLDPADLTCVYCGVKATCWDHLVPAARDGTHQIRNLAPACTRCNNSKGSKTWAEFFEVLGNTPENAARRSALEAYTQPYQAGETLITDPQDQQQLAILLERIHQAMSEADELIAKAIAQRREEGR